MSQLYPPHTLNLAAPLEQFPLTRLNGPGLRWSLFVQGCSLRCTTDCLNDDQLAIEARHLVTVQDVVDHLLHLKARYKLEGVTFLGGEPFDQAESLAEVAEWVQANGMTVMTYSGYGVAALQSHSNAGWQGLLTHTDLLVEGPFLIKQASPRILWRGSRNQRLLLLNTQHYQLEQLTAESLTPAVDSTSPVVELYEPYFEGTEIHWSFQMMLENCHQAHTVVPVNTVQWCPECAAQQSGRGYGRKGLIALITSGYTRLYGHQQRDVYQRFAQQLSQLGIELNI